MSNTRRTILAISTLATAAACHQSVSFGDFNGGGFTTIHGSGNLVEVYRAVGAVTSVTHASEGELHVKQLSGSPIEVPFTLLTYGADGFRVEGGYLHEGQAANETLLVRAEDNLLPYLITESSGGHLVLRTAPGVDLQPTLPIEFYLEVTSLDSAALSGVGKIDIPHLAATEFALTSKGVGSVQISNLQAVEFEAVVGGIGQVRVSGDVERQTVDLSGIGDYRADDLQTIETDVLVAGIGSATVRVRDLLIATVTSSGSVYYIGSPEVDATITGSGKVEQIEP